MNENRLTVKEYKFRKPDNHKIVSIIDKVVRDCHRKYFHTFEYRCLYYVKFTNTTTNQIVNITIDD